jgi:hypothetical protein
MILPSLLRNPELISDLVFVACLAAASLAPPFIERGIGAIENLGARFAARRTRAIVAAGVAPILLRIGLLKWFPPPIPGVHDEFSYLLAADTFAHGRLTNPTPPLWVFFETFHVNMQPTYMSKYQPAQGAMLAIGQLLGHPWMGVLLSVGLMCAAIVWALQGWMPSRWAFLGGMLAAVQFGIFNYWTDSYWGGAVPAVGGALVFGALARIWRKQRPGDAVWFGVGAAILANSRPWEGAIFCAAAVILLGVGLRKRSASVSHIAWQRVIVPLALVLAAACAFMGYYNWRLTGNALLFPYVLNDRTYLTTPHFAWQTPQPPREYRNAEFDSFYNDWTPAMWKYNRVEASWRGLKNGIILKLEQTREFYLPDYLCVVIVLAIPWIWRDRKTRKFAVMAGACVAAVLAVVWYQPHYAAPMTAALFAIVMQAMRYVRRWKVRGWAAGVAVTRAVALAAVVMIPVNWWFAVHKTPRDTNEEHMRYRAEIASKLEKLPGKQLVIVRYRPEHDPGEEWVYNGADLENAHVIWAREISDIDPRPLLNHYRDRQVWLVDADGLRLVRVP